MPIDDENDSPYRHKARKYRGALLKTRKELQDRDNLIDELVKEHEELQGTHASTAEERDTLKAKTKTEAFRKAFDAQASKANVDPKHFDDLWKLAEIDTSDDEPDPAEMAKTIKAAVKARVYMIKQTKPDDDEPEVGAEGNDEETGDEGDDEKPLESEVKPAKLSKGEGNSRGGRAQVKAPSIDEQIDSDFAETGRSDSFRI